MPQIIVKTRDGVTLGKFVRRAGAKVVVIAISAASKKFRVCGASIDAKRGETLLRIAKHDIIGGGHFPTPKALADYVYAVDVVDGVATLPVDENTVDVVHEWCVQIVNARHKITGAARRFFGIFNVFSRDWCHQCEFHYYSNVGAPDVRVVTCTLKEGFVDLRAGEFIVKVLDRSGGGEEFRLL
jgi:hypothetical protein